MGLSVQVGLLADLLENDPEEADDLRAEFIAVNAALAKNGISAHSEPETCEIWGEDLLGYSGLHALREVAGLVWKDLDIPYDRLLDGSQTAHSDDLFRAFLAHTAGQAELTFVGRFIRFLVRAKEKPTLPPFTHLVVHSDNDGMYFPIDLERPFVPKRSKDETAHLWPVGSVPRLLAEVNLLAERLGIPATMNSDDDALNDFVECPNTNSDAPLWQAQPIAAYSCVVLREACHQSLHSGAAIHFC